MEVYRILKAPFWVDPFSTVGAQISPGRWNPQGVGILYTASSPALSLLETLVHFPEVDYERLPALRLFSLSIPDEQVLYLNPASLPLNWDMPEQVPVMQHYLKSWLDDPASLAIAVPSAVLSVSYNFLLHPQHPAFASIAVIGQTAITVDKRLWR